MAHEYSEDNLIESTAKHLSYHRLVRNSISVVSAPAKYPPKPVNLYQNQAT